MVSDEGSLGETSSLMGTYKVIVRLRALAEWGVRHHAAALNESVFGGIGLGDQEDDRDTDRGIYDEQTVKAGRRLTWEDGIADEAMDDLNLEDMTLSDKFDVN